MDTVKRRYNAGVQRAKGLMELAAALYDSSLSTETSRAAEGVLQIDSRVGAVVRLSLGNSRPQRGNGVALSLVTGGFEALKAVGERKVSLTWVNPSVGATLAFKGKGPFTRSLPLRLIAVFPSYDVVGFAVHESTGITSLAQIREEKIPLRLSTGRAAASDLKRNPTMFTVAAVLKGAGFSLPHLRKWGGKIQSVPRPSYPERRAGIEKGAVNAVFDEGIKSWGQTAVDHGFRYLSLDDKILQRMEAMGYRRAVLSSSVFRGMSEEASTVDFSGWPMVVHRDMPEEVAYALCEAIEARKDFIPTDNFKPLDVAQLCANDGETPYDVPLHPGAERFYRERGYLK